MTIPDRYLNPEEFRLLIRMHGFTVRYYRALPCPCRNPNTGDFSRNCPMLLAGNCDGATAYREQTLNPLARVFFDRAKKTIDDAQLGLITVGDIMAYCMPDEVPLERNDRMVVTGSAIENRETRQRGTGGGDLLTQLFPFSIDAVSWLAGGSDWVDGVKYTDFDILTDADSGVGQIMWIDGGNAPAPGQNFTIIYRYRPRYFASGVSFMPSRASVMPGPFAYSDPNARYGLPIRALMTLAGPFDAAAGTA